MGEGADRTGRLSRGGEKGGFRVTLGGEKKEKKRIAECRRDKKKKGETKVMRREKKKKGRIFFR